MHSSQRTIDDMICISDGIDPHHYIKGRGFRDKNGIWRSYTKKELEDLIFNKPVNGVSRLNWQKTKAMFYKNLHEGPNENNLELSNYVGKPKSIAKRNKMIDANTQEQYNILDLLYTYLKTDSKMADTHKKDIEQMQRYEQDYYKQYEKSKTIKTIDTQDTQGAKEVYTKLKENRPYLGYKEVQKVRGKEFRNATDFELDIAGIDKKRLISQKNLKSQGIKQTGGKNPIMRYNAEYENLDDDKYKYIRKEISLVPALNKWVEKAKQQGYEIQVRSYNTNMDVFYDNKPLWGGDNNFKVDTLVDIRAIRKVGGVLEEAKPPGGLIIEDKYYGRSYATNKALPQYYSDTSMLFEGRNWDRYRKKMTADLRKISETRENLSKNREDLEEELKDYKEQIDKKKINIEKINKKIEKANDNKEVKQIKEKYKGIIEEYKGIIEEYKELKKEYEKANEDYEKSNEEYQNEKNRLSNIPEISKEIKSKFSKDFSPSIEITKVPYSDEILHMDPLNPKWNKNIELMQEKAKSSKSGYYQIDDNTNKTTGILKLNDDGTSEPRSLTRVMGQYDSSGNFHQYVRDTENFDAFKDRYMTTAIADNDNLLMSYIPRNLTADEVEQLAHSAYKKGKDSSYRLGDNVIYLENR